MSITFKFLLLICTYSYWIYNAKMGLYAINYKFSPRFNKKFFVATLLNILKENTNIRKGKRQKILPYKIQFKGNESVTFSLLFHAYKCESNFCRGPLLFILFNLTKSHRFIFSKNVFH